MKRLLLFAACSVWAATSWAQLLAPTLTFPTTGSTVVDVNVRLTWNPALGGTVSGYDAEIDTDSNFTNPVSLPTTGTSAKTSELDYNQKYYWRVRGIDANSTPGAYSDVWSFSTFYNEFTGLAPNGDDKNPQLNLSWDTIPGTATYHYEYDTDSLFPAPAAGNVGHTPANVNNQGKIQVQLTNLVFGQKYFYRIYAEHAKDQSGYSEVRSFTVLDMVELTKPSDMAVDQDPRTTLECDNTPGVTEYRFAIDDSPAFDPSSPNYNVTTVFGKDFSGDVKVVEERLFFGQTYHWRVQGTNASSTSSWSEVRTFTVLDEVTLQTPEDGATDVPNEGAVFTWQEIKGVEHYEMQYDTLNTFATATSIITPNDTNKIVLNLPQWETGYHWRVRAIHSKDTSGFSPVFSFNAIPVGIEEKDNFMKFSVYPNPASDFVSISLNATKGGILNLEVYSIVGKRVDLVNYGQVNGNELLNYSLDKLERGSYFLVLDLDGQRKTSKLSVK